MCTPLLIASAALAGASTAANAAASRKVQGARDDALAAERLRQQGLDREAAAINTRTQDRFRDFDTQQEGRAAELADFFRGQTLADPGAAQSVPASASNITVREEDKQRGAARERTDQIGGALGDLRAFGDLLGGISRKQGVDASLLGQIGGFKRGSNNVLGFELEDANRAGGTLRTIADLTGGLGQIGLMAGLSKGPTVKPGAVAPAANSALNTRAPNIFSVFG